jgi:hemoglobin
MESSKSLYEQLGGEKTVDKAVKLFYDKVLSDPDLMEFFVEVNMDQLKRHQKNFLTVALGGPNKYTGRDMRKAHEHLKLQDLHFDLIKKHLSETLNQLGANKNQIQTILNTVEPLRNEVLNKNSEINADSKKQPFNKCYCW